MPDALLSADDNRAMFDRIARRYDLMNSILSLGLHARWRRRAVRKMKPREGGRYLDVGCGTADVAIEILRQCPGCRVVGIDPAGGMLDIGRRKLAAASLSDRASLQTGNVVSLPLESHTFDAAIAAFCLRNVTDRVAALAEMGRVVRPGGLVMILELTRPRKRLMRLGHRIYTRALAPLLGAIIAGDRGAYRYLVDSVMDFPAPEAVLEMMTRANLANPHESPMTGGAVTVFAAEAR
jgi:demethylmenaquinone methyltransferase/2-methoxy-6-polyprenyl-1,4-benzoquinol methylase